MKTNDEAPVALQCNGCEDWSKYSKDYIDKMPRSWIETEDGYFCNTCRKAFRKNPKGKTGKFKKKVVL